MLIKKDKFFKYFFSGRFRSSYFLSFQIRLLETT